MGKTGLRQLAVQARFDLVLLWRSPVATFFTIALPIIFLFLLTSFFGNELVTPDGPRLATRFVPGILALSVVSATFVNLAIITVTRRENSILKRVRGTPMRPRVYISGQIVSSFAVIALMTALVILIGWTSFDVSLQGRAIPTMIVTLVLGGASFCALGLAATNLIPNETSAPAVTNAIALPLYFVSDVYIPSTDDTPRVITAIGDIFPIRHMAVALQRGFDPLAEGSLWPVTNWLVMAAWGVAGALVVSRWFRWTPRD